MITLEQAKRAMEAAEKKAQELNIKVSIAIVDDHGTPIMLHRMDGAISISSKFALEKAYTSANLCMETKDIAKFTGEGQPFYGLESAFNGELMTLAGGVPIMGHDGVMGAVGVGGSQNPNQDLECANAAVAVLES